MLNSTNQFIMSEVSALWQEVESIFISTILGNSITSMKDVPNQCLKATIIRANL